MDWDDDDWDVPSVNGFGAEPAEEPVKTSWEDEDVDLATPKPPVQEVQVESDRKVEKQRFDPRGQKKREAARKADLAAKIAAPAAVPQTAEERLAARKREIKADANLIDDLFGGDVSDEDSDEDDERGHIDDGDLWGSGSDLEEEEDVGLEKFDGMNPRTKEEFSEFARLLGEKITVHQEKANYTHMLVELLRATITKLDTGDLDELSRVLSAQGNKIKKSQQNKRKPRKAPKQKVKYKGQHTGDGVVVDDYDNFI